MTIKVLVLGASGMLGSTVNRLFSADERFETYSTSRTGRFTTHKLDLDDQDVRNLLAEICPDLVINCIGVIPQNKMGFLKSLRKMFQVNTLFSRDLSRLANARRFRLIQPCTNAVYCGNRGPYSENSLKIPRSIYGITKLYGERNTNYQINLRCSIIGPEIGTSNKSLYSWLANQEYGASVEGFTNHLWNGITTNIFSQMCLYLAEPKNFIPGSINIVPTDFVSKYELLLMVRTFTKREDLHIEPKSARKNSDLRLATNQPDMLNKLWEAIGFSHMPKIIELF
jgi:dTDP-4-dehydrorhamnose reductase